MLSVCLMFISLRYYLNGFQTSTVGTPADFSSFRRFRVAKWRPQIYNWNEKRDLILELASSNCIRTTTNPSFTICILSDHSDRFVSATLRSVGFWELNISAQIKASLFAHPAACFLDVGANIGYHSLSVAAINRSVYSVEPYPSYYHLFHASVLKNAFQDRITVYAQHLIF